MCADFPPILVPIRGLVLSKSRLRDNIQGEEVNRVIKYLFEMTINILLERQLQPNVLTADQHVKEILPPNIPIHYDDGQSLNQAIIETVQYMDEENYMIVMPDLPGFSPRSLTKILHLNQRHKNVLLPTGDGGTAVAILPKKVYLQGLFGNNSTEIIMNYCNEEKIALAQLILPELSTDLDTLSDWNYWAESLDYLEKK